jgi:tetratricopeptide (TPR) repeat protein
MSTSPGHKQPTQSILDRYFLSRKSKAPANNLWEIKLPDDRIAKQVETSKILEGLKKGWFQLSDDIRSDDNSPWRSIHQALGQSSFKFKALVDARETYGDLFTWIMGFTSAFAATVFVFPKFIPVNSISGIQITIIIIGFLIAVAGFVFPKSNGLQAFITLVVLAVVTVATKLSFWTILAIYLILPFVLALGFMIGGYFIGGFVGKAVGSSVAYRLPFRRQPLPDTIKTELFVETKSAPKERQTLKVRKPKPAPDDNDDLLQAEPISKKRMELLWLDPPHLAQLEQPLAQYQIITVNMGSTSSGVRDYKIMQEDFLWAKKIEKIVNKAYQAGQSEKYEDSIKYYKQALKLAPGCDLFLMSIGVCYAQLGRKEEAIRYLERANLISPDNSRIRDNLNNVQSIYEGEISMNTDSTPEDALSATYAEEIIATLQKEQSEKSVCWIVCYEDRPLQGAPAGSGEPHLMIFTSSDSADSFITGRRRFFMPEPLSVVGIPSPSILKHLATAPAHDSRYVGPPCGLLLNFTYPTGATDETLSPEDMESMNADEMIQALNLEGA